MAVTPAQIASIKKLDVEPDISQLEEEIDEYLMRNYKGKTVPFECNVSDTVFYQLKKIYSSWNLIRVKDPTDARVSYINFIPSGTITSEDV